MLKLAVIADDLTGANDAGVQFAKQGLTVQVVLDEFVDGESCGQPDVLVLDTDSRATQPEQAYERVRGTGKVIRSLSDRRPLIFKKMDSTLRGNPGREIDAAMDEFELEWAAVAPAFPANGRITVGGWHLLHQVPIAESEIARDPKTPVHESVLPDLLTSQSRHSVGHIFLAEVSKGEKTIIQRIRELRRQGIKVVSFDASTDTHLRVIASAVANIAEPALWVGCAGLAETIPAIMGWNQVQASVKAGREGTVLVAVGSVSPVSARQVARFLAQENTRLVLLRAESLLQNDAKEVLRCVNEAAEWLRSGKDVLLASAVDADAVAKARSAAALRGIDSQSISQMIVASMGRIVKQLVDLQPTGLFLTGGDTAVSVCRALGVHAIEILDEVLPGIPLGQLVGGCCTGLRVVTKAGAFGGDNAIVEAVKVLKGRRE